MATGNKIKEHRIAKEKKIETKFFRGKDCTCSLCVIERYGRFMMFCIVQITDRFEGMLPLITFDGDLCGRIKI